MCYEESDRIRDASGDKGAYSVSPVLPSDIMGVYVFLSAIGR